VRIEQRLPLDGTGVYPRCIAGRRRAPPEDCGGPLAFMAQRDRLPIQVDELLWQLQEDMRAGDLEAIRDRQAEIDSLSEWLALETFDRRAVNRRLEQYAMNDAAWMC
jgi:Plasmid pRiA4b ORF-3-like protein